MTPRELHADSEGRWWWLKFSGDGRWLGSTIVPGSSGRHAFEGAMLLGLVPQEPFAVEVDPGPPLSAPAPPMGMQRVVTCLHAWHSLQSKWVAALGEEHVDIEEWNLQLQHMRARCLHCSNGPS